jgi:hypothetical protein
MPSSSSDKNFFPQELRKYSEVCLALDEKNDNKILITSTQTNHKEIHNKLKLYNQGYAKRDVVFLKNPPTMINGLPQGIHGDIYEVSTDSDEIEHTKIVGNGYCGLVTAIVAKGIFDDSFISTEFIDEKKDPKDLKQEFYDDWERILAICPDETKNNVRDLRSNNASRKSWLYDTILEIINHGIRDKNNFPIRIGEENFGRSPHSERKIAFLKHLSQASDANFLNAIQNGLGGISLQDLLSGSDTMNPNESKLCLDVLTKFTRLLGKQKNTVGSGANINQEAVFNFYNLMAEAIEGSNFNHKELKSCIEKEKIIKSLQDSFNTYFELKKEEISQENKKLYQSIKAVTRECLLEKLSDPIEEQKKSFFKRINLKSEDDPQYYYKELKTVSDKFDKEDGFKSKISQLEEIALSNALIKEDYCFLIRNDNNFLEAMLPDSNQLKPQFSFDGWGKKIEFSDYKITIEGQEVDQINFTKNDGSKEDIVKKLYEDYQGDPKRFQLGVIDFFRNADEVELVYKDNSVDNLEQGSKKKLKYVNGKDEVQEVKDDDRQEKEKIDYFKIKLDAYLKPQQTQSPNSHVRSPQSQGSNPQRNGCSQS